MKYLKDLGVFILGLILIIGGFLSFVSIGVISQYDIDININLPVALGFILIILGIISMYFFVITEDKKKKPSNTKPTSEG